MYKLILSQNGDDTPTALLDTLEVEIEMLDEGSFLIKKEGFFEFPKTVVLSNQSANVWNPCDIKIDLMTYAPDAILVETYYDGVRKNECLNNTPFIISVESDYTDTELSAISHAQSILYRTGLKDLALSIGAPRPKKP